MGERHTLSDGGKGKKKAELRKQVKQVKKQIKLAASAEGGEIKNKWGLISIP